MNGTGSALSVQGAGKDIAVNKEKAVAALKVYIHLSLLHYDFTLKINYEKLSN